MKTIGEYAFYECTSLTAAYGSSSGVLQRIGKFAFSGCPLLENVFLLETTMLGENAFDASTIVIEN